MYDYSVISLLQLLLLLGWCVGGRYTALDYALMGEHFDVCQYMIEHSAVSITGIRDIAALKIQASVISLSS